MSDKTNIPITRFSKEVSDFIESQANCDDGWYWFGHYFKKVGDCLFEEIVFKETPYELKHIVERSEDPNPGEADTDEQ